MTATDELLVYPPPQVRSVAEVLELQGWVSVGWFVPDAGALLNLERMVWG